MNYLGEIAALGTALGWAFTSLFFAEAGRRIGSFKVNKIRLIFAVTLYTITFDVSDTDVQTMMETCATDSDKYFDSPSEDDLETTFRIIGAELKALHISQ